MTIPAGEWTTGSLELKDGVELHLPKGAVLKGSPDRADYNPGDIFPENPSSVGEEWSGGHLVYAYKRKNVAITGEGTLDGNGPAFFGDCQFNFWFPGYKYGIKLFPTDREWFRPGFMVALFMCRDVRIEGVTLANSPCWTCHIRCSDGVKIRNVTIDADRTIANSDGFSIDCTRNVTVERCAVRTGDDGFAIRASCGRHAATNFCENIVVRDCTVDSCCYGARIGIGTGTIRNVTFENCRFGESCAGVGLTPAWVTAGRNVYVEGVRFTRCFVGECLRPVETSMPEGDALVKDVTFEDCEMESLLPSQLNATEKAPAKGIRFVRCRRKALLDGLKVRQDSRWLMENRAQMRRDADLFWCGNAEVSLEGCSPTRGNPDGVLLLTFDGRDFDGWQKAIPVFDRYGAHATFFVSGEVGNDVVRTLKRLRAHGHSIGICDDADFARRKRTCDVCYVPVASVACPDGCGPDEIARVLAQWGIERVRTVASGDAFPAAELPKRRIVNAVALDGSGRVARGGLGDGELGDLLMRAAKNREVVALASHGIAPDAKGAGLEFGWLEKTLTLAKELGLRVIGFDELPPPENP